MGALAILKVLLERPLPSGPQCWLRQPRTVTSYILWMKPQLQGPLAACYMNLSSRLELKMLSYAAVRWACASTRAGKLDLMPAHWRLLPQLHWDWKYVGAACLRLKALARAAFLSGIVWSALNASARLRFLKALPSKAVLISTLTIL